MELIKEHFFDLIMYLLNNFTSFFHTIGIFLNNNFFHLDTYGIDFVNLSYGASSVSENILKVYNIILFIELLLLITLSWILIWIILYFKDNCIDNKLNTRFNVHYTFYKNITFFTSKIVEFLWTLLPIIILIFIGYPSLALLYLVEERINPEVIVKVIGHQWYWSYENDSGNNLNLIFITNGEYFNAIDEFYELVRFVTRSNLVSINYPYAIEKWCNELYGIKELTNYDLDHKLGIYCLMGNIINFPIICPFVDKFSINDLVNSSIDFYGFIVELY